MEESSVNFKYNFDEIVPFNNQIESEYNALISNAFFKKSRKGENTNIRRKIFFLFEMLYEKFKSEPWKPYRSEDLIADLSRKHGWKADNFTKNYHSYCYRINEVLEDFYINSKREIGKEFNVKFEIKGPKNNHYLEIKLYDSKKDKDEDKYRNYLEIYNEVKNQNSIQESSPPYTSQPGPKQLQEKIDGYFEKIKSELSKAANYIDTDVIIRNKPVVDMEDLSALGKSLNDPHEGEKRMSVIDGLGKYFKSHVLLVGGPGTGKTAALNRFLLLKAQEVEDDKNFPVPILLSLKYFKTSIENLIFKTFEFYKNDIKQDEVELLINDRRLIYLFDGINEAPSQDAIDKLFEFIGKYPDVPMVFTTRAFSTGGGLKIKNELKMQPLTSEQINEYARINFIGNHMKFIVNLNGYQRELSKTPLFLKMFLAIFEFTGRVPSNLGETLRRYIEILINNRDINVTEDEKKRWHPILQHIAFKMMEGRDLKNERFFLYGKEFNDIIRDRTTFDNPKQVLNNLIDHHLIISHADGKIEFVHQVIQEYFATEYLLGYLPGRDDDEIRQKFLNYTKWTDAIEMMLGLCKDEGFIERIINLSIGVDRMFAASLSRPIQSPARKRIIEKIIAVCGSADSRYAALQNIDMRELLDYAISNPSMFDGGSEHNFPDKGVSEYIGLLDKLKKDFANEDISAHEALEKVVPLFGTSNFHTFVIAHETLVEIGNEKMISILIDMVSKSPKNEYQILKLLSTLQYKCMIYNPALT